MIRYVALLRGINISGKNKIAMPELKKAFEELNYNEVITYINSGNIIFSCETEDRSIILNDIRKMIKDRFNLDIPVLVITIQELEKVLSNAPDWWGNDNKEIYDNIIFIIPPTTYEEVFNEIGEAKKEYEQIDHYENVIYWSFELKSYSKTNWIKTASSSINDKVTIRTANTVRKILKLGT